MASMRSASFEISHFDQAIKSSVSKLGDKRIKEITSLQRKVLLGFLKGRDTFACLPTGYGKSLIYQLAVRVAAELSVVYNYKDLFSTEPVVLVVSPLNSSAKSFYENIYNFKKRLRARGYPHNLIEKITSEVKFTERKSALQKNNEVRKKILPFVTTYHPALPNLKNILMSKWHLIQDQPLLREIYNEPPIISYKRAKWLGDILVRAKL